MDWKQLVLERLEPFELEPWRRLEIAEELAQHLEQTHADALAGGAGQDEAMRQARAQLGDKAVLRQLVDLRRSRRRSRSPAGSDRVPVLGDRSRGNSLEDLGRDLRYVLRSWARQPGFALVAIVTLALGIGANTGIFSIAHAVLLRPLPYTTPERLHHLFETEPDGDFTRREASWPDFVDWSARRDLFESVAGYNGGSGTLTGRGVADRVRVVSVTDDFFEMLGVRPALGRLFEPGDSGPDAGRIVVLDWGSWQSRFGGDPELIGESIHLSGQPYTVVGVLPPEFEFSLRGTAELWLPLSVSERQQVSRSWHWLDAIARLREDVSPEQAMAGLVSTAQRIGEADPTWHEGHRITLVPLRDEMTGRVRPVLLAMMGSVVVVLLIVCSNLGNLLLARAAARRKEIGVRSALGADRGRLLRQLLAESLLLSSCGGVAGLLVAAGGSALLLANLPEQWVAHLPHLRQFGLHWPAFLFASGIALVVGVSFGLAPALRVTRANLVDALKEGRGSGAALRGRLNRSFVVSEIALTLVLLVAAGLMSRSLMELLSVSPGFDTENLLTARVSLPSASYADGDAVMAMERRLREAVEPLPGVRGVATVSQLPLTGRGNTGGFNVQGLPEDDRTEVNLRSVSRGYFALMGIPLLHGRVFERHDGPDARSVVLVNETLARRSFGGAGALGERISFNFFEGQPWWEIVGVVGDERVDSLDRTVTPIVYFVSAQDANRSFSLLVRSSMEAPALTAQIRETLRRLDPDLPLYDVRTMASLIAESAPVFLRRYLAFLIGGFAVVAASLAAIGIYGVTAHSVEQRRHEIGVRLALGAAPRQMVGWVLGFAMRLAAAGVALGLIGSLVAARAMSSLLFGVSRVDPWVWSGVALALVAVVLLACSIPARRALLVDPTVALRAE